MKRVADGARLKYNIQRALHVATHTARGFQPVHSMRDALSALTGRACSRLFQAGPTGRRTTLALSFVVGLFVLPLAASSAKPPTAASHVNVPDLTALPRAAVTFD